MMNVQLRSHHMKLLKLNSFSLPESNLVAMTSEGIEFDVSGYNTDRLLFVARNDNASTAVTALKVKAGDGYAFVEKCCSPYLLAILHLTIAEV